MRRWWRMRKHRDDNSEATRARQRAEQALEQTKAETPMYAALGESLRQRREANHLTELFLAIHQRRN